MFICKNLKQELVLRLGFNRVLNLETKVKVSKQSLKSGLGYRSCTFAALRQHLKYHASAYLI